MKNIQKTKYCLKIDVKKFYLNIDPDILKGLLRRKIKDRDFLELLDEIIDSADGLPIGNLTSQIFANFYMCGFDHWIKEKMKVDKYFRYCDDIVIPSDSKEYLHQLLFNIREYFEKELKLTIKDNYQISLVEDRSVDIVGYKHYHNHKLIRKGTKKRFAKMLKRNRNKSSLASYMGLLSPKHCNSKNLLKKLV